MDSRIITGEVGAAELEEDGVEQAAFDGPTRGPPMLREGAFLTASRMCVWLLVESTWEGTMQTSSASSAKAPPIRAMSCRARGCCLPAQPDVEMHRECGIGSAATPSSVLPTPAASPALPCAPRCSSALLPGEWADTAAPAHQRRRRR